MFSSLSFTDLANTDVHLSQYTLDVVNGVGTGVPENVGHYTWLIFRITVSGNRVR